MKIRWPVKQCILCLEEGEICEEHLIPRALGGILTCNFLCRACNSRLGSDVEASAKSDPSIHIAILNLHADIPELAQRLIEGSPYCTTGEGPRVSGYIKDREFRINSQKHNDGSLIPPTEETLETIRTMLKRDGHKEAPIKRAVEDFSTAFNTMPENQRMTIMPGLDVVKRSVEEIEPDFSRSTLLNPLLPAKIAFEFLALCVGELIYTEGQQLCELRTILKKEKKSNDTIMRIERLFAGEYRPFHGICNEKNPEFSQIQIRLFGHLVYCVHFPRIRIDGPRYAYTHCLKTGQEDWRIISK